MKECSSAHGALHVFALKGAKNTIVWPGDYNPAVETHEGVFFRAWCTARVRAQRCEEHDSVAKRLQPSGRDT